MNNITRFPEAAGAAPANATVMRSREQAYVVTDFGRGIADAFQALGRTLARLKEITEEAYAMQELALLSEQMLAARGLTREGIASQMVGKTHNSNIDAAIRRFHEESTKVFEMPKRDAA
jgi:hypothetical protein